MPDKDPVVYTSESGDLRKKEKPAFRPAPVIKKDGTVRVQRESKGRGGKTVSVVYGLPLSAEGLLALAAKLKQKCGAGGTVKDGAVIIQGDRVEDVIRLLAAEGFTVKRAGG